MIPREYDYEIIFGKPILIEKKKKFKNYKAFINLQPETPFWINTNQSI